MSAADYQVLSSFGMAIALVFTVWGLFWLCHCLSSMARAADALEHIADALEDIADALEDDSCRDIDDEKGGAS